MMLVLAAGWAGQVGAGEIDTGNPDISLRWDNTLRYNVGKRVARQDQMILNSRSYDESDGKFGRYATVTNRIDLLSEADIVYQQKYGFRISAAGWYDKAYDNHDVKINPAIGGTSSYANNTYSSLTKRYYNGPSGELLDLFVFGKFYLGDSPINIKVGRHALIWGESVLFGAQAISYAQSPSDGRKGAATPGSETKELTLPTSQISFNSQLSENVAIAGQYFYEWKPNRLPEGGTYFAPSDTTGDGPQFNQGRPRLAALEPRNRGAFGTYLKWTLPDDTNLGFYFRRYDERQPWTQTLATGFRTVYATNAKLYGFSVSNIIGGASVGAELSYRQDGALNSSAVSTVDNQGARGNTYHAILNSTWGLAKSRFYDASTLVAELAASHLDRVTAHPELFRSEGYAGCPVGQDYRNGCSTRNFLGVAVNFTPSWYSILPSIDLSTPMSLNYGIRGNGSTLSGGNQGAVTGAIGITALIQQRHEVSLRYSASHATSINNGVSVISGNGNYGANDRGLISLTLKTQL
jgi:hypothetical protein